MPETPEPEPMPEGATWVVRDPEGRIVEYSTEPIVMKMDTRLGEQITGAFGLNEKE